MNYFLLWLSLALIIFLFQNNKIDDKLNFWCGIFFYMLISLPVLFRNESYGLDIVTYYRVYLDPMYYQVPEPGLSFLNGLFYNISHQFLFFKILYFGMFSLPLLLLVRLLPKKYFFHNIILLSTYYLMYQFHLNIYRQGVAVILLLLVFVIIRNSWIQALLAILIGLILHKIAFIGVVVGVVYYLPQKKNILKSLFFVQVLGLFLGFEGIVFYEVLSYIPVLKVPATEYMRVMSLGLLPSNEVDHRNVFVFIAMFIFVYSKVEYSRGLIRLLPLFLTSILLSTFFIGNVLIYDRLIVPAQIIAIFVIVEYVGSKNVGLRNIFYTSWFLIMILFTFYLWGPNNFMPDPWF